jgi:hypothetical protein
MLDDIHYIHGGQRNTMGGSKNQSEQRLRRLRTLLQQELISDNPGLLYIEDLKLSIDILEREIQYENDKFIMVEGVAPSLS